MKIIKNNNPSKPRICKIFLFFLLSLSIISFVSAIECTPNQINKQANIGETPSSQLISCTNNKNYTIEIFKSGTFFSIEPTSPAILGNLTSSFTVNFNQMNTEGKFNGFIYSSDGTVININLNITPTITQGGIIVFPTSKIVNIKQGQTKDQNIQVIVPSNYPRQITIQSVSFNPDIDVVRFGDLNLGLLNPGQTLNIPLIIDAKLAQTGTYNTQITILATDTSGQLSLSPVNMQVIVSIGTTPASNETFSTRPDCSLSSLELNLNSSYIFSCTNIVENLEVNTQYNDYLEGIIAEYGTGTYKYTFKAKKYGTTTFLAPFTYKGSPIFEAFSKEIRITPSGANPVSGVVMAANFYQNGIKKELDSITSGETIIMVLDNQTKSLIDVNKVKLYLNGQAINNTFILEPNKEYELRASSVELGYLDLVLNFSATKISITIIINPSKSFYNPGEQIEFSTTPENSTILLNAMIIAQPYTLISSGNFTFTAKKEGYADGNITVEVKQGLTLMTQPIADELKKGKEAYFEFNQETFWEVYYMKNKDSETELINNGTSKQLSIKFENKGIYWINADGNLIWTKEIKSSSLFGWIKWWYILILAVIVIIFIIIKRIGSSSKSYLPSGFMPESVTELH